MVASKLEEIQTGNTLKLLNTLLSQCKNLLQNHNFTSSNDKTKIGK